jgi:hypothetical protein
MGKNQDPGSGINIPDPPHCIFSLFSGKVQLPSWQKERITAPARIPVKQEVIFEIKREVSEPKAEVGKTVEDPVKHRVKKHAIRMVVLRFVFYSRQVVFWVLWTSDPLLILTL